VLTFPSEPELDLEPILEFACDISRETGRMLIANLPLGRWRGEVESKAGRELVSRVDREAERMLVARVLESYPDHAILAEEGGAAGGDGAAKLRWRIDPLDGTTNYLHGVPIFSVSLAVEALRPGMPPETVVAVVYAPYLDETFFGARGIGAFLNSRSIRLGVSSTRQLDDALVATGFAYERERYPNYDNFVRIARAARGIRRCGSAALDLAYVAAGRYDAFWELGLKSWDVAAGALLVLEAGGRVGDFGGGGGWLEAGNIVATNQHLFDTVRELLDPLAGEPKP
jgi:myo-inositol-1(or 4)-monophosphatase